MKVAVKCLALAMGLSVCMSNVAWTKVSNEEIALSLSTLLRSARAVISDKQKHINNPDIGDKGLTADVVVGIAKDNYKKATGTDIDSIDPASLHGQLIDAELQAVRDVMDEAQDTINEQGVGFARLVTQDFGAAVGDQATIKLTAPKNYVRNRANRPDKWEHKVIETMFRSPDHETGQHFAEVTDVKGKEAYRLILPEYYKESCLACHGEPKGERDITGGKKEGGTLGELGGAISVVIFE